MTKTYKGKGISKLSPSGYYEIYSDCAGRFLKFDTVRSAKARIDQEIKGCGGLSGGAKTESYAAYKRRQKRIAARARRTPGFIPYRADPYERD